MPIFPEYPSTVTYLNPKKVIPSFAFLTKGARLAKLLKLTFEKISSNCINILYDFAFIYLFINISIILLGFTKRENANKFNTIFNIFLFFYAPTFPIPILVHLIMLTLSFLIFQGLFFVFTIVIME